MYNIIDHADHDAGIKQYVVDTIKETMELPGSMGSTALCLEDMSLYIRDGKGNWRKLTLNTVATATSVLGKGAIGQIILA